MDIFPFLYIIPFFIYLYWVFFFVKDDFILLRKNVSADQLFSLSIIGVFVLFLFSRFGYVISYPKSIFANPLVFLAFPYFPGFSESFGIIGIYIYVYFYTKKRKLPFFRILDILVYAFCQAMWVSKFLDFFTIIIFRHNRNFNFLFSALGLLIWSFFLLYVNSKNKFKDGSIGYMGLSGVTFILFISNILNNIFFIHKSIFLIENIFLILLTLFFLIMFIKNERSF